MDVICKDLGEPYRKYCSSPTNRDTMLYSSKSQAPTKGIALKSPRTTALVSLQFCFLLEQLMHHHYWTTWNVSTVATLQPRASFFRLRSKLSKRTLYQSCETNHCRRRRRRRRRHRRQQIIWCYTHFTNMYVYHSSYKNEQGGRKRWCQYTCSLTATWTYSILASYTGARLTEASVGMLWCIGCIQKRVAAA